MNGWGVHRDYAEAFKNLELNTFYPVVLGESGIIEKLDCRVSGCHRDELDRLDHP